MSDKFELSRRKALLGLGTVGLAGAGAGVGTSALYSDTERTNNNTITAGTTNLAVTKEIVAATNPDLMDINSYDEGSFSPTTADGDVVTGCQIGDMKPGDKVVLCIAIAVTGNPMYVAVEAENVVFGPGNEPEPELNESSETNDSTNGDLDDFADVRMGWDATANDVSFDGSLSNPFDSGGTEFDDTLGNFLGSGYLGGGVVVRGRGGSPPAGHSSDSQAGATRIGDSGNSDASQVVFYVEIEIPTSVGNVIQGDKVEFDLAFSAEQVRNNTQPDNASEVDGSAN